MCVVSRRQGRRGREGRGTGWGPGSGKHRRTILFMLPLRPHGSCEPWLITFYTLIQAANKMPGTRMSGKQETQFLPSRNLQFSRNIAVNQSNTTVINGIQKICTFNSLSLSTALSPWVSGEIPWKQG